MQERLALVLKRLLLRTDRSRAQAQTQRVLVLVELRVQRERRVATASFPPAPAIARLVDGDPVNPRFQVRIAAKAFNTLKNAQESLLRQVARLFRLFRQPIEQGIN